MMEFWILPYFMQFIKIDRNDKISIYDTKVLENTNECIISIEFMMFKW